MVKPKDAKPEPAKAPSKNPNHDAWVARAAELAKGKPLQTGLLDFGMWVAMFYGYESEDRPFERGLHLVLSRAPWPS